MVCNSSGLSVIVVIIAWELNMVSEQYSVVVIERATEDSRCTSQEEQGMRHCIFKNVAHAMEATNNAALLHAVETMIVSVRFQ